MKLCKVLVSSHCQLVPLKGLFSLYGWKRGKVKMSYKSSLENAFLGASADFTAVGNTGSCNSIVFSVFSQLNSLIDCWEKFSDMGIKWCLAAFISCCTVCATSLTKAVFAALLLFIKILKAV